LRKPANLKTKWFWATVSVAGTFALVYSLSRLRLETVRLDWMLVLTFTMLLSWRAEVWIPGVRSKITLSDTFICIAILMLGPWAATVLASIDGLARSPRAGKTNIAWTAFINMSSMNVAVLSASLLAVRLFGPLDHLLYSDGQLDRLTLAIGVITLTNYLINSSIAAIAIALFRRQKIVKTWTENYLWASPAFFIGAIAAGVICKAITILGFYSFVMSLPILLLTYIA